MDWGNCGCDSRGRPIGYVFDATCDHPGCDAKIDRGLAYACGGMHGEGEYTCEGYFCEHHATLACIDADCFRICLSCYDKVKHLEDDD